MVGGFRVSGEVGGCTGIAICFVEDEWGVFRCGGESTGGGENGHGDEDVMGCGMIDFWRK